MMRRGERIFRSARRWTNRIERAALALLVLACGSGGAANPCCASLAHGVELGGTAAGHALLWLTMLGALAAAGLGRHPRSTWPPRCCRGAGAVAAAPRRSSPRSSAACSPGRRPLRGLQREMDDTVLLGAHVEILPRHAGRLWLMTVRFGIRALRRRRGWFPSARRA
jgi:hypothetical protein